MSRSIKKGPYVQEVLLKRVQAMNEAGEKKAQDMEPFFYHFPGFRRPHYRCA